jgi:IS30 family transposase
MMINDKSRTETITDNYIRSLSETLPKLPNILIRNNNAASQYGNTQPLERNKNIARMNRTRKSPNNELQMAYTVIETLLVEVFSLTQWFNYILQKLCLKLLYHYLNQLDLE